MALAREERESEGEEEGAEVGKSLINSIAIFGYAYIYAAFALKRRPAVF